MSSTTTSTIAVAGGTGGIGRAIVEELARSGKHKVVILSRKASTTPIPGFPVEALAADYTSIDSLKNLLATHNVTTVISALMLASPEASTAQLNLIHASIATPTIHTFIPTEYGIHYTPAVAQFHPPAQWWLDASNLLRSSRLRYTLIIIGWLLDTHGHPHFKSYAKHFKYVLDFDRRVAVLPGSGEDKVSVLHSLDIAKYIRAMIEQGDDKTWPEVSAFASDRMSWGEMVRVAERVMGEKWTVTHDSVSALESGQGTLLPQPEGSYEGFPEDALRHMISEFGLMAIKGSMDVSREHELRNDEFPEVEPVTVEGVIKEAWGRKD